VKKRWIISFFLNNELTNFFIFNGLSMYRHMKAGSSFMDFQILIVFLEELA
jgi:hypothetical protein